MADGNFEGSVVTVAFNVTTVKALTGTVVSHNELGTVIRYRYRKGTEREEFIPRADIVSIVKDQSPDEKPTKTRKVAEDTPRATKPPVAEPTSPKASVPDTSSENDEFDDEDDLDLF